MSLNTKLLLPVALGVSLVTVSAFVLYYILKKDESEDETNERLKIKTSRVNTIEVTVSKSIIPALLGRGGSNIKDMEKKSGAAIRLKKLGEGETDVCVIRGSPECTQLAESLIHEFINNQPTIEEEKLLVPQWACGRIIGTGGESITDISHRSGARVKVEGQSEENATLRQITFRGTKAQIKVARELVEKCVAQEKCRREIESSKRSPRHTQHNTEATTEHPEVVGAAIEVYVSAVSSPSRFWVQFVGPQVTQLDVLVQDMTDYYSERDNRELHALSEVTVGQVVAAIFRHDGRWYRARVDHIRPNEFDARQQVADVFFLDYGDSEYVATHELCELRGDLLRMRFQAMECFLAGVRPAGREEDTVGVMGNGQRWDKWHSSAIQRFEELTQVARWKSLVSKTCTYKKAPGPENEKEREIPGIKLFDVTEEGELDIGGVLVSEGWAVLAAASPPRTLPPAPPTPFGDLGASRVLGMLAGEGGGGEPERASSLPRDPEHVGPELRPRAHDDTGDAKKPISASLSSGLEMSGKPATNLSYPDITENSQPHLNGSHDAFLNAERHDPNAQTDGVTKQEDRREELKANINRIDSHHASLETLGRTHLHEPHK